jgi:hypothetical protein
VRIRKSVGEAEGLKVIQIYLEMLLETLREIGFDPAPLGHGDRAILGLSVGRGGVGDHLTGAISGATERINGNLTLGRTWADR